MESFFQSFKGTIKDKKGEDLGGRYFAIVLAELFREHPELLHKINDKIPSKISIDAIDTERYSKDTSEVKEGRRADLSIDYNGDKTLNIEIKWRDKPHEGQIDDYLNKARSNNGLFMLISLDELGDGDKDDLARIEEKKDIATYITCPDIYKKLKLVANQDWLIRTFLIFLEENAMIYEEDINYNALIRFMKQSIGWQDSDGFGRTKVKSMVDDIPLLLRNLMGNVQRINSEIKKLGDEIFSQEPITDFSIESHVGRYFAPGYFKTQSPSKDGKFCVFSTFSLSRGDDLNKENNEKNPKWQRMAAGIYFEYKERKISLHSFAIAYGQYISGVDVMKRAYDEKNLGKYTKFPKMEVLEKYILKNMKAVLKKELGWGDVQKELLKRFGSIN